jgi:hypothetical protein
MLRTRVVLGSRETHKFVSKEFYDAMHMVAAAYQMDFTLRPTTIEYKIPPQMVVEREEVYPFYGIQVCDSVDIPICHKYKILEADTYLRRQPKLNFDRFRIMTELFSNDYYLLVPHAQYYDTCIIKDWTIRHINYDDVMWEIHFKQVYVDPHDSRHTIWFFSQPKYQIELISYHDYRQDVASLKKAILHMLPRSFR